MAKYNFFGDVLFALLVIFLLGGCSGLSDRNEESAIETSLIWARMAPLPESAANINVVILGSSFTREFQITFVAKESDIEQWIADSPGANDAIFVERVEGVQLFKIKPAGSAQFAELTVDWSTLEVVLHTYWS